MKIALLAAWDIPVPISLAVDSQNVNHTAFFNYVQDAENQYNYTTDGSDSPVCSGFSMKPLVILRDNGVGIYNDVAIKPDWRCLCSVSG